MKKKLFFLFFSFLILFSFLSLFLDFDWNAFKLFSLLDVLVLLISLILETFLYTSIIFYLVKDFGYNTSLKDVYLVLTASLTANYATPFKVGVPLRVYLYKEKMGIPVVCGTSIILIEIFLNVFISFALSSFGVGFILHDNYINPRLIILIPAFFIFLFFYIKFDNLERFFTGGNVLSSLLGRGFSFIHRVKKSLTHVSSRGIIRSILLYLLILGVQSVRIWLVLLVVGESISIIYLLFVIVISTTIGTLSMIPMGIGAKDVSFTFLLVQLGVPADIAVVVATIHRLFAPGWPLFLGLISANILGISNLSIKKDN